MQAYVEESRTEAKPDCLHDSYEVMRINHIYNIYINNSYVQNNIF
jgi:hypothetical protein